MIGLYLSIFDQSVFDVVNLHEVFTWCLLRDFTPFKEEWYIGGIPH